MGQHGCLICAPIVAKSVPEVLDQMQLAKDNGADVIELRIDHIINFKPKSDLQNLLEQRTLPALVTYRPKWEGGEYEGDEDSRLDVLRLAIDLGADFVDVELQVAARFMASLKGKNGSGCQIIVSNHNYQRTPSAEELGALVAEIQSTGADIVKFATTANKISDVASVFQVLSRTQVPTIALVMGPRGLINQLLCAKFGGYLTFGSLGSGQESIHGQPTLLELTNVYRLKHVNRATKVFGVIANPVGHSKGPVLHNAAFWKIGFDAIYVPFLVDDLAEFLDVYSASDFAGFSVGIPHKEAALKCCDEVEPIAQAIGAVNTIVRRESDGKLIGYNTDCEGAISAIEDGLAGQDNSKRTSPLRGKTFVIIGAGGAGKALAFGAKQRGAHVVIANRTYERAKLLASAIGGEALTFETLDGFSPEHGAVLANATSVGMHPNIMDTPISKKALGSYSFVFDAVYTPRVTRLLQEAEAAGATVVSGVEMFIRQAIAQFELFTSHPAPEKSMREIITKNL